MSSLEDLLNGKKTITAQTKNSAWESKGNIVGNLNLVSSDPQEVCKGTKFFLICGPAHIHEEILKKIAPFIEKDSFVGTLYGQGSFAWTAYAILKNRLKKDNITIWALLNVPSICKTIVYGESVNVIGPKNMLYCAAYPDYQKDKICNYVDDMFGIPTVPLPNLLCMTLTPSNQIIHPGRVYGFLKDWDGKTPLNESDIPLLYEGMDDFSADQMQKLDDEIQAIKAEIVKRFPHVDLSPITPMKDRIIKQYGDQVKDKTNLKTVFATNQGYTQVRFPMIPVEGGVILNPQSRFFWEDIPYGLCILKDIAQMVKVKTPQTDKMIEWHQKFMNKKYIENGKLVKESLKETGCPSKYGIKDIEKFLQITASQTIPKL